MKIPTRYSLSAAQRRALEQLAAHDLGRGTRPAIKQVVIDAIERKGLVSRPPLRITPAGLVVVALLDELDTAKWGGE